MSIETALERQPVGYYREIVESDSAKNYKEQILAAGVSIFLRSGAMNHLQELKTILEPEFPDVEIGEPQLVDNMVVFVGIKWDFEELGVGIKSKRPVSIHKEIRLEAYPLNGDLVVANGTDRELLTEERWRGDPKFLEDAIVIAYQDPIVARD